jgi:hypothetical protein
MDTIDVMQGYVTVRSQDRTGQPVILEFPDGQRIEVEVRPAGVGYEAAVIVRSPQPIVVFAEGEDGDRLVPATSEIEQSTVRFDPAAPVVYDEARRDAAHVCSSLCGYVSSIGREDGIAAYFTHVDSGASWSADVFLGPRAYYVAEEDNERYVNSERAPLPADEAYASYVAGPFGSAEAANAWLRSPDDDHLIKSPGVGVMYAYHERHREAFMRSLATAA